MIKLYIVRHGKTTWNTQGLIQGKTDIELSSDGIEDAKKLSKIISLDEIDICISSPLKRAKETAKIITNNKIKIITDELLVERDFGNYEGTKVTQELIERNWDYSLNDSSNNIESLKDLLLRSKTFLDKIKKDYQDKSILIVSHGCFIKCLHFNITGYDENTDFLSFFPKNTTLYKYEIE